LPHNVARYLLHRRFEAQAQRTPDAIALRSEGSSITYRDLDAASSRVAAGLRSRGIGERALVGLHIERSIPFVVAVLGILKANGAVVPLPPSYPEARRREILAFSQLDAVIDGVDSRLAVGAATRVFDVGELGQAAAATETGGGEEGQAAFVLCSSGSTGQPKMIVRSHRSFFHRLEWTWQNWPYAAGEVCCQKSHMTTTHSIYELFEPLLQGVTVNLIADETVRHLEQFWDVIRAAGVSRLLIVPSVLQASLDMPGFEPPPIRVLVLMGEYVHSRLAGRAMAAFPPETRIFSIYGSTEASSTLVCDVQASYREGQELPLGKPISPDVKVLVLGSSMIPVAAGASGLLYISGPALFTEYFRDPDLTASMFVHAPGGGARLFNTKDQVRVMADGSIEFVGRVDHTVKVRGFRVDLGEVERAMLQQPQVQQAVAMLGDSVNGNAPLVAFYTPATASHTQVASGLRERLPVYMLPSVLVGLESFPLTASGKVDRRRLLEEHSRRATAAPIGAPLSPVEARIADVWKLVLQQGEIGADSHFFEIGGTSLTVFSVVHRLRETFGLDRQQLTDHAVYQYPTLRDLAKYVESVRRGGPAMGAQSTVAVTLRQGRSGLSPLFVIASSGGTLGAYDRLSKALKTEREIVGIRDPFVWGARDPTMGFQEWISLYVAAIRERQPAGPYFICAFSSAGAFGCEIAQRLRRERQEVARLVLIDPIGIAGEATDDFGHRAFAALFRGRRFKWRVRLEGAWRFLTGAGRRDSSRAGENDFGMSADEVERRAAAVRRDQKIIRDLSSLFELNTGLPFTLTGADFEGRDPGRFVDILLARVKAVTPDVDLDTVERILVQYYCLQLPATHFYRLKLYDGRVEIFEPESPQVGLLGAYFRPYVKNLRMRVLGIGIPSERTRLACENLSPSLRTHYRSMRDDEFVRNLAAALEPLLAEPVILARADPTRL
jgi:amino acid adenylation domain-containing protein